MQQGLICRSFCGQPRAVWSAGGGDLQSVSAGGDDADAPTERGGYGGDDDDFTEAAGQRWELDALEALPIEGVVYARLAGPAAALDVLAAEIFRGGRVRR